MNRVRPCFPLIGFVVPTVAVGYGVVIPRSCIAGVNELTIGFGSTLFGAILTYVAGQRAVMPRAVCSKPPLSVRIARAINKQAAAPSGFLGRVLGAIWPREHGRLNVEVLDRLDLRAGQNVLEIGCGVGAALGEAGRRVNGGKVVGLDISELMVCLSLKRNRKAAVQGELQVRVGDVQTASLDEGAFDRIFAVHCLYFWADLEGALGKLTRSLRSQGKLVLAFMPDGDNIPARFRDPTYRFPRLEEVEAIFARIGFSLRTERSLAEPNVVIVTAMRG